MQKTLIVALAMIATSALGQKNFRAGYILKDADTLKGMVQYREGSAALGKCTFQTAAGEPVTYLPTEIKAFGYDTRHFKSITIRNKTQFVEIIVEGRANLLRRGQDYFVQKDTALVELTSTTTDVYLQGRQYKNEEKGFALRLNYLFSDCPSFKGGLEKIQLFALTPPKIEYKFSDVVASYNTCMNGSSKKYEIDKNKKTILWGIVAGVSTASGNSFFSTDNLGALNFKGTPTITGGLFLDCVNPRLSEKFHLRVEADYVHTKLSTTKNYPNSSPTPGRLDMVMEYSTISVPVTIGYNFTTTKFSPFLRAGLNPIFRLSNEFTQTWHNVLFQRDGTKEMRSPMVNATIALCASAGADYALGKHTGFFEIRFEPKTSVLDNADNFVKVSCLKFLVGMRF